MEFARRGRATDEVVDDGHRFFCPPPHVDPMLVIRDALLSQLQMDRLRQEVIIAELANIERAMDLRHASRHGIAANDVEWTKPVPFTFSGESMLHCRSSVDPERHASVDERFAIHEPKKWDERLNSVGLKSRKPAMEDRVTRCLRPCCCKGEAGQEDVKIEEEKLQESTEIIQLQNTSPSEKWELTEITIPVKKPRQKLICDICQGQATSEHSFKEHCAGRKHRSNLATLESNRAISQKAQTTEESSSCTGQKTSSIKWGCITCHVSGTSETDLKEHLNGRTHQLNIETQHMEGDGVAKDVELQESEDPKSNAPKHAEKPPIICSICQASCARESDLGEHLLAKIQALLGKISNKARNSKSQEATMPPNIVPQHAEQASRSNCSIFQADFDYQSELGNHIGGKMQQLNVQVLHGEAKKMEKIPQEIANFQQPPSEWDSGICQAKCNSESQFDDPLRSSKHQKNIEALQGEGENAKSSDLIAENKVPTNDCDRNSATSEKMEEQPALYFCEVCNLQCNSSYMLADHCKGEAHREKQKLLNFCKVCNLQCNSEKMLVHHSSGNKHQKKLRSMQRNGMQLGGYMTVKC